MTRTWRSSSATTPAERVWGGRAQAESPEWTPASSTCSMTPADHHLAGGVPHGVHVHLHGVLQEPVDQHRSLGRHPALAVERHAAISRTARVSCSSS